MVVKATTKIPYFSHPMYPETLQELGLSLNEARIYEALLKLGKSSISQIAVETSIHRRNVYDAVNRLVEKGIITPVIGSKDSNYLPVDPGKLLEIVEEKRQKLQKILPALEDLFKQEKGSEGIYILKGIEGYKNALRDILNVGQTCYTIAGKSLWTNPSTDPISEKAIQEGFQKNIKYHTLFDATAKEQVQKMKKYPNQIYRFLPEKYSSPTAVDIYGDRVVVYVNDNLDAPDENLTLFMIVSKKLADSYRQWFQFMWDHSKETPKTKKRA
jgi:HTH-type transcriptional regulator, sugar sensing transcriptional regulator